MGDLIFPINPGAALAIHVALSAGIVAAIIVVAAWLREKRSGARADVPYEGGVLPAAPQQGPVNAPYFLIAALFVIFDMEAAILFAWAVAARDTGWLGLIEAAVFIGVLLLALVYLWADGALDWHKERRR
ncbi:NADH-quinone oxidoreductase subunit A [Rhodopseudomonas palustris]|uniref:NADH-quinone oxidoreductase subunit A n=1 Tax=Rhodopseudomonas palustris (strain BisB5) TaxID=316057 RepID=NUOA_RHOPS|nr:RecName: Full=NADH-quinone oxidoreductase subunit A; AltName: Full=NADH dehydrogenase I subunit A; AltName: Full=NDH-1 subunit A; AltName: Full=NUO1 [Rhodopseudomonas palustris BisB5]ABE38564.1 NADH-ubiquinone/plastoquinone oxidoreductase, chain 3 [Rhodopseudomonas palustris BisB5]MBB1091786.1 NADH-quinone oxidoreductase subunit A [Rhodopseudomonas palustris]